MDVVEHSVWTVQRRTAGSLEDLKMIASRRAESVEVWIGMAEDQMTFACEAVK